MSQRIFKISLLGEGAVGKTSLRRIYLGESFKEGYMMTIGADFAVKKMSLNHVEYTLQIWDLAGQQRFSAVREVYYRGTAGALLVFDISRPETYEVLPNWLHELIRNNKNRIVPIVLIGNKADLRCS
ncbi:MAG: Rab family GTPase [Candidatus Heimdallarchaeaceae archaeon]